MNHDKRRFSVILLALALAVAPHVTHLPLPITLFVCLAWGYSLGMQYQGWPVCPRWLKIVLALGCLAVVISLHGRSFGRDAGVALLVLMLGLKAVESKSVRDQLALIFLSYFVIVTNVLYSQSLVMSLYMIFSVLVVTAALVHLHSAETRLGPDLRRGGILLLQSLPLAVLLFVFFPRLQGALWGVHDERDQGTSGFSETLEPGSVAGLSLSREVAFRVDFNGPIPDRDNLYWRGMVLDSFDGLVWSRRMPFELMPPNPQPLPPTAIRYALTLEPHGNTWIFALDLPVAASRGTVIGQDHTLASMRMLRARTRYELAAVSTMPSSPPPSAAWTSLPDTGNPLARELAQKWLEEGLDAGEMVERMLALFRDNGFVYSLRPGSMDSDIVDRFLFETRQGYCEHYASAMAFVLRAARIPARVVVGYQGGEPNPMGGYLIVRQSDAHAWVEAWLNETWTRLDPTSVVAPLRLAAGVEPFIPTGPGVLPPEGTKILRQVGRFFQLGWDSANNSWNQWVLGFSHERQRGLWERLGFNPMSADGAGRLAITLLIGLGAIFSLIAWMTMRSRSRKQDRVVAAYARFCRALQRTGLGRSAGEGPTDHLRRVAEKRPDLAPAAQNIVDEYVALRYRPRGGSPEDLERLVAEFIRRF